MTDDTMAEQTEVKTEAVQTDTPPQDAKKRAAPKRRSAKKERVVVVRSKRKTSVARAYLKAGKGLIKVNSMDINALEFDQGRSIMLEPIALSNYAKDQARKIDIKINVQGGGISSQIQAVRGAIAKGLVEFTGSDSLRHEYLDYDRAMLVDDPRRVEPKKFKGPKARARFQTSYR